MNRGGASSAHCSGSLKWGRAVGLGARVFSASLQVVEMSVFPFSLSPFNFKNKIYKDSAIK